MTAAGSPHSETLGSKPARRLPEAYRCPPRLSSVPSAKASTIRPCRQPHTRGKPARPNEHRTTDHQHSAITKRSNKQPDPHQRGPGRNTSVQADHNKPPRKGRPRGPLASTLQFSNHHATPHAPTPMQEAEAHGRHPTPNPPPGGPWPSGNPTACPYPPPRGGATILPRQHARHPKGPDPREPCQALNKFSVERR